MKYATVPVPYLGGDVEVQAIPPKLQRTIHAKSTRNNRVDFQELMVWKLVYGLKSTGFTEKEARKVTLRYTLRVLQPIIDMIDRLSGTDEHLRNDPRPHRTPKIVEPVVIATAWLNRFPDSARTRTREPHGNGRPARRAGSRRTTNSRSGPDDDPGASAEPAGRRCENARCQADISHLHPLAHFCDDGGACKQQAYRDRRTIAHLDELAGTVTVLLSCICSPQRNLVDEGQCVQCGYPRGPIVRGWLTDPAPPSRSFATIHSLKRRSPQLGDGKRRLVVSRELEAVR
jgi:hypothetical protein